MVRSPLGYSECNERERWQIYDGVCLVSYDHRSKGLTIGAKQSLNINYVENKILQLYYQAIVV